MDKLAMIKNLNEAQEIVNNYTGTAIFIGFRIVIIGTISVDHFVAQYTEYEVTREEASETINNIGARINMENVVFQFKCFGRLYLIKHLNDLKV